jgi:predicted nucleotidyltransferase component of viral defense system
MIGWLTLKPEQRKAVIDEAEQLSGIPAKAIEKDWWVIITLKALFQSAYRNYLVFKGGTSLSKGWNLIARFSEDIDIALDPQAFGMGYKENPTKSYVDKLKRKGCEFKDFFGCKIFSAHKKALNPKLHLFPYEWNFADTLLSLIHENAYTAL